MTEPKEKEYYSFTGEDIGACRYYCLGCGKVSEEKLEHFENCPADVYPSGWCEITSVKQIREDND